VDTSKLVETKGASQETARVADSGARAESARLIEMGAVSTETKGQFRGLELGFLPKS
jgi:hypothetical protein